MLSLHLGGSHCRFNCNQPDCIQGAAGVVRLTSPVVAMVAVAWVVMGKVAALLVNVRAAEVSSQVSLDISKTYVLYFNFAKKHF